MCLTNTCQGDLFRTERSFKLNLSNLKARFLVSIALCCWVAVLFVWFIRVVNCALLLTRQ
jgi:hypothetical protein